MTAALFAVAPSWRPVTRWLVGWDVGVLVYLAAALHMMLVSDVARIRRRAAEEDEGQLAILMLTVAAAVASLAAIIAELDTGDRGPQPADLVLASLTIVLSWAFIHMIFALHYAHEFYDEENGGGMAFPGDDKEPDYLDFVYFSFVIGMTSQVSDVGVTSKPIRRCRDGPRNHLVPVQRGAPRPHGEHRRQRRPRAEVKPRRSRHVSPPRLSIAGRNRRRRGSR